MLSAVVLTKNEEKNIKECLKCLNFCDEILVIDDYSSDETIKEIKNFNLELKIFQRHLDNNFASQRNFGLGKAKGDWILFVDADERISAELAAEIRAKSSKLKAQSSINGFYLKRQDRFLGKWLKYGETASVKLLRLARKDCGQWQGKIHEVWQVKGKIGELKNPLLHKRDLTIAQFLERINFYSSIRSQELYQRGCRTNMCLVTAYPLAKFLQNYFLRFGFLDGVAGFIMAGMMSLHSFLVRGKLWIRQQNQGREEFGVDTSEVEKVKEF